MVNGCNYHASVKRSKDFGRAFFFSGIADFVESNPEYIKGNHYIIVRAQK